MDKKIGINAVHAIEYNKVMIIVTTIAISVSFNHMKAEQNDAVNQFVLRFEDIA